MIKNIYKRLISEKKRIVLREKLQQLISPFYFGDNYYCNCCNKKFRKFISKGNITRQNAQCPFCSSLERTRVLDLYLKRELNLYLSENIKVLHFAPENALFRQISRIKNIEYIDADINSAYARHVIDVTAIPFADQHFDYIICSHVLGHVPNEQKALEELYRVTKPNGIVLILTLLSNNEVTLEDENIRTPAEKLNHYGESDLCRLHGNDFVEKIQNSGFRVDIIDYRLNFPNQFQQLHSLGNGLREKIFKCTRI